MSRPKLQEEQAQLSMWIRADLRKAVSDRAVTSGESQKVIVERALETYLLEQSRALTGSASLDVAPPPRTPRTNLG